MPIGSFLNYLDGTTQRNNAVKKANNELEATRQTAGGLTDDTMALMNPNVNQQVQMAVDTVMGNFGGAGNLNSSGARRSAGDRAQAIASNEFATAQQRAMEMQRNNQNLTAGIQANNLSNAMLQPSILDRAGQVANVVSKVFG